jgi:hypothetical protein
MKLVAGCCALAAFISAPLAMAADRVFYETFDDPASVDNDLWFDSNNCGKKLVGEADGAVVHQGLALRGNWFAGYTDPITGLTSADSAAARYAGYDLMVHELGIVDEMFVDYWAFVDDNAAKAYGAKWMWLEGTYDPVPGEYHHNFNHILLPPWQGWDTWKIVAHKNVGESGGSDDREVHLSEVPGIQALLGGDDVDSWFQGQWHHFQVYVKLNTPASEANGILKFWLDEVLVMDLDDYRYRDHDDDHISHVVTPHMYGGGDPPPASFGWQLDELAVWDAMPDPSAGGAGGQGHGAGAGGSAAGSGPASASSGQGSGASGGEGPAAATGDPSSPGGGSGGSCSITAASAAGASAWALLGLVPWLARERRLRRRTHPSTPVPGSPSRRPR